MMSKFNTEERTHLTLSAMYAHARSHTQVNHSLSRPTLEENQGD